GSRARLGALRQRRQPAQGRRAQRRTDRRASDQLIQFSSRRAIVAGMSTTTPSEPCQACLTIDRADGVEDGNLYKVEHYSTRNERSLLRSLQRTQDRVADAITTFAGSLNFVYIHSVWFGVWILLNVGLLGAALEF